MKNSALAAKEKIKAYYQKTDAAAFTVATIIDPCLKLFYHEEHGWEKIYIDAAKEQFKLLFEEHYYHPMPAEDREIPEDDLIAHIYMQNGLNRRQDELELYLAASRAPAKTDILQWWKVSYLFFIFKLNLLIKLNLL